MLGKGVSPDVLENLLAVVLTSLDAPVTRSELAEKVSRELGGKVRRRRGGGWGSRRNVPWIRLGSLQVPADYLLHLAGARGVVCYGPREVNETTFVRADAWLRRRWRDVARERAEVELLRRYLKAFAPANPEDFALWSGIRKLDAAETWSELEPELAPVEVSGWSAWMLRQDLETLENGNPSSRSVRLLPHFDSYLLAHRDRGHLVDPTVHAKVFRPQGWIYPTVLLNGRVAGNWSQESAAGKLVLRIEPFADQLRGKRQAIQVEAAAIGRFLGYGEGSVHVDGLTSS